MSPTPSSSMARVVYHGASGQGDLFHGTKFWLSAKIPLRGTLMEQIQSNGGVVVKSDNQADIILEDHLKAHIPNSYSWKWVHDSVRQGELQNIAKYRNTSFSSATGPRHVGSSASTASGTRNNFEAWEDQLLWDRVQAQIASNSKGTIGDKVFQQLEAEFPRHTRQSWSNRYKKTLKYRTRRPDGPLPLGSEPMPQANFDEEASLLREQAATQAPPKAPTASRPTPLRMQVLGNHVPMPQSFRQVLDEVQQEKLSQSTPEQTLQPATPSRQTKPSKPMPEYLSKTLEQISQQKSHGDAPSQASREAPSTQSSSEDPSQTLDEVDANASKNKSPAQASRGTTAQITASAASGATTPGTQSLDIAATMDKMERTPQSQQDGQHMQRIQLKGQEDQTSELRKQAEDESVPNRTESRRLAPPETPKRTPARRMLPGHILTPTTVGRAFLQQISSQAQRASDLMTSKLKSNSLPHDTQSTPDEESQEPEAKTQRQTVPAVVTAESEPELPQEAPDTVAPRLLRRSEQEIVYSDASENEDDGAEGDADESMQQDSNEILNQIIEQIANDESQDKNTEQERPWSPDWDESDSQQAQHMPESVTTTTMIPETEIIAETKGTEQENLQTPPQAGTSGQHDGEESDQTEEDEEEDEDEDLAEHRVRVKQEAIEEMQERSIAAAVDERPEPDALVVSDALMTDEDVAQDAEDVEMSSPISNTQKQLVTDLKSEIDDSDEEVEEAAQQLTGSQEDAIAVANEIFDNATISVPGFTADEAKLLFQGAEIAVNVELGSEQEFRLWSFFANGTNHTVTEWMDFFDKDVLPAYRRYMREKRFSRIPLNSPSGTPRRQSMPMIQRQKALPAAKTPLRKSLPAKQDVIPLSTPSGLIPIRRSLAARSSLNRDAATPISSRAPTSSRQSRLSLDSFAKAKPKSSVRQAPRHSLPSLLSGRQRSSSVHLPDPPRSTPPPRQKRKRARHDTDEDSEDGLNMPIASSPASQTLTDPASQRTPKRRKGKGKSKKPDVPETITETEIVETITESEFQMRSPPQETQAILDKVNADISMEDLALPAPEGGWENLNLDEDDDMDEGIQLGDDFSPELGARFTSAVEEALSQRNEDGGGSVEDEEETAATIEVPPSSLRTSQRRGSTPPSGQPEPIQKRSGRTNAATATTRSKRGGARRFERVVQAEEDHEVPSSEPETTQEVQKEQQRLKKNIWRSSLDREEEGGDAPEDDRAADSKGQDNQAVAEVPSAPIDIFIAEQVKQGFSEKIILDSLWATSNSAELTLIVARAFRTNGAIPGNMRGVWTDSDDKLLKEVVQSLDGKDGQEFREQRRRVRTVTKMLADKHGGAKDASVEGGVMDRIKYLEAAGML